MASTGLLPRALVHLNHPVLAMILRLSAATDPEEGLDISVIGSQQAEAVARDYSILSRLQQTAG